MKVCHRRFNLYFLPIALLLVVSGCALWKKKHGPVAVVRVHVETETSAAGSNKTISIMRSHPLSVNISTDAILSERDVISARVIDTAGDGFALEIKFEDIAGWRLEQYSASNPGKHLAIFAQWSEKPEDGRWLAAPLIPRRMAEGILTFTPDATREEVDALAKGLTVVAKKNALAKPKK